jgi:hypothetical protein
MSPCACDDPFFHTVSGIAAVAYIVSPRMEIKYTYHKIIVFREVGTGLLNTLCVSDNRVEAEKQEKNTNQTIFYKNNDCTRIPIWKRILDNDRKR